MHLRYANSLLVNELLRNFLPAIPPAFIFLCIPSDSNFKPLIVPLDESHTTLANLVQDHVSASKQSLLCMATGHKG